MTTILKKYFPIIRERGELLAEIEGNDALSERFRGWEPGQQEEFLDICTGVKGLKFLYDGFFKELHWTRA